MSVGRVCAKHEEWCPDGVCRWCEPSAGGVAAYMANLQAAQEIGKAGLLGAQDWLSLMRDLSGIALPEGWNPWRLP